MIRIYLPIIFLILSHLPVNAQILRGRITGESGNPIPYATVYIQELKQGTTSNTKGDYEIRLPAGKYQVIYQSLGYSPVFYMANTGDGTITKDVILPLQYYQIPEVRITATGEDPAYGIMRKAIGLAPYYLNNISYYKAEVYLKGNLVIKKIPRLFQKAINAEAKKDEGAGVSTNKVKEGDVYLMESFNELEFTAPDKFSQKVISVNSTFPDQGDNISPMDFINASFYQPLIGNLFISPLSPQAFSYYKFKYQGASPQGNYTVNKIQVIPKIKSQQLFDGTIFIIEDLWCLHSVDLTNDNIAGKVRVQQVYVPVENDIWMPVSHKFEIDISIMGIKADASYGGSVKYLEVRPNLSLQKPESVAITDYTKPGAGRTSTELPPSKNQQKAEKILEKDELSNRDMVVLSRIMNEESKKARPDSVRNNLEVKENVSHTIEKDAGRKDSAYWAEIRPIPLSDLELKSIRVRDSIKKESSLQIAKTDTLPKSKKRKNKFGSALDKIATGNTWSDTTGLMFRYDGLLKLKNFRFNTVDGFSLGQDFRLSKNWKNNTGFTVAPSLRWAFSREKLMWIVNGNYRFNGMKQNQLFFRTGMTSADFLTNGSINPFLNSLSSLFMKRNYVKLYDSKYLTLGYRTEIINGLKIEVSGGWERRDTLKNTTSYSFTRSSREYSDNFPDNQTIFFNPLPLIYPDNLNHFEFVTNVTFTPRQKYSIYKDSKVSRGSDWPTFSFTWEHGYNDLPAVPVKEKHYDALIFGVSMNYNMGAFTEFRWSVRTGGFTDNRHVPYYDFFHFNSQPLPVLLDDYRDVFRLPAYYSQSTREFFGEGHIKYTTPYLLIKYLPGISKTLMRENLTLSYLGSRYHRNYSEIGYSISEIFLICEAGIYTGFEDLKFKSLGFRFLIKIG